MGLLYTFLCHLFKRVLKAFSFMIYLVQNQLDKGMAYFTDLRRVFSLISIAHDICLQR